jgi:hypothetical protein
VPTAAVARAREQPLLALQRSAGNRATGRYLARARLLARQDAEVTSDVELIPQPGGDVVVPQLPPSPNADPRELSDWIDRRITQVGFSLGLAGFVLWSEGAQRPMFVHESQFAFDATPMAPADMRVYENLDAAVGALPQGPPAPGAPGLFNFHRAPGGTIVPTLFTPQTAPRTVEAARDARQRLIDEFTVEFVELGIGMAAPRIVSGVFNGLGKAAAWAAAKAVKKFPGPSGLKPAPATGKPPAKTAEGSPPTQAPPAVRAPLGALAHFRSADEFAAAVRAALRPLKSGLKPAAGAAEATHLPFEYHVAIRTLDANPSPVNEVLRELTPIVASSVRDPELAAEVMAAAWTRAARDGTDLKAALISLATEGGVPVTVTGKFEAPGKFFDRYATQPARIVDPGAGPKHGELAHVLQDLLVDLGFLRAGRKETAIVFRQLMRSATGHEPIANISAGDAVWRGTYDPLETGHMNTPESLNAALAPLGFQ